MLMKASNAGARLVKSPTYRLFCSRPGLRCVHRGSTAAGPLAAVTSKTPASPLPFLRLVTRGMADSIQVPKAAAVQEAETDIFTSNPLLQDVVFPLYDQVKAEHVVPGMRALLAQLHKDIDALESSVVPTWSGLVEPLEQLTDHHQRTWGIVSHLKGVKDSDTLRAAVEEVQPENVALGLRLSQSKPLYQAFKALQEGPAWKDLTEAQQRVVDIELRDFVLGGVALEGEAKERYNAIQQELAQLSTKFSNNVLDATKV
eukprot:GHRR01028954.1.p1 GENE.GHRR01028954.1~~GHRR01028954.1.p1  ORF type:complete len:258 (+),score=79.35 GHRR01028954.1:165-938(+)